MNFGSRNSNSELSQIINEKIYKVLIKIHKRRLFKCYASKFLDSRKEYSDQILPVTHVYRNPSFVNTKGGKEPVKTSVVAGMW